MARDVASYGGCRGDAPPAARAKVKKVKSPLKPPDRKMKKIGGRRGGVAGWEQFLSLSLFCMWSPPLDRSPPRSPVFKN